MGKRKNDVPQYLFHQGTNYFSHRYLGAHFVTQQKQAGVVFRVWAPHAEKVCVVGSFNDWQGDGYFMNPADNDGIWELFVPGLVAYDEYKFRIFRGNKILDKADPFAVHAGTVLDTASKLYNLQGFRWTDESWISRRALKDHFACPMNIYELHLGSWRRYPDGNFFEYRKAADEIVAYVSEMGYTHIELLPVMEHPYDGSWGYQTCGYFAPTSRYGTPKDFMYFINLCHEHDIGVILDWVPSHFPKDAHGLYRFDGDTLYESADPLRSEQPQWGTVQFDYGRPEIQSFLISSAMFWLEQYHVDGLRVDAVSSMLYLDFGREEAAKNSFGGNENLDAVAFLRKLNAAVGTHFPGVLMIAEESTAWPMVTQPPQGGGLGFHFKWNMGWMNDMLEYMEMDPIYRRYHHKNITFSFFYAFSENYVLPISHDEVVHGKKSLLDKMPGTYEDKFAQTRALLSYMFLHPGKKLSFMGAEIGQFKEWDFKDSAEWFLLQYPHHDALHRFVRDLNHFYLEQAPLWEQDCCQDGFDWLIHDDTDQNIVAFVRRSKEKYLVAAVNFSPVTRENYCIGVPDEGTYREIFTSDLATYGGSGITNGTVETEAEEMHGKEQRISLTLPGFGAVILEFIDDRKDCIS